MLDVPLCDAPRRLEALHSYRILDTPDEPAFDEITKLVAKLCDAPIALITLVDAARQWFKSAVGVDVRETSLDTSICVFAIQERELLVVEDTLLDPRFASLSLVAGPPHLRFYAGAVLRTPEGQPLGTICVLDVRPRQLSDLQKESLRILARQVMTQLELRRHVFEQARLIEEQKRIEAELQRAKEEAEAANDAKSRFLANLSHELRTPLTPVLMTAAALQELETLPESVRADLDTIRRNVEMEARLIDDMLDITRISHGKLELHLAPVDLHAAVRDALEICQSEAYKKEIDLSFDLGAEQHHALGDAGRLQQVFWNLIRNAVKFTPQSGQITIRSRNGENGEVLIEVTDTGIGLEPAEIPQLFKPFEQGRREITRRYGGLGLGLAICEGIVALHGGRLSATSEGPGRGATFRITLAPAEPPAPAETRAPASAPERQAALYILLVEDHEPTAHILQRLLTLGGHRVRVAGTVKEALAAAAAEPFQLLISDLGLPDGTGFDLMREMRQRVRPIPGIALTGYGMESDVAASREAGFSEHLTKPVDWPRLQAAVARVGQAAEAAMAAAG